MCFYLLFYYYESVYVHLSLILPLARKFSDFHGFARPDVEAWSEGTVNPTPEDHQYFEDAAEQQE